MINIKETLDNSEDIYGIIKKEIVYIASFIDYQKNLKNYIAKTFDTISLSDNIKENQATDITNFFKKVYQVRLNLDCNIIILQDLFKNLRKIKSSKKAVISEKITEYNNSFNSSFSDIKIKTTSAKKLADELHSFIIANKITPKKNSILDVPEFEEDNIKDNNILKISEKTGKVYLPYSVKDLDKILSKNASKYTSKKDLINKKYIIPLSYYKNSSYARFKEAYKLIREKENGTISDALNLAFELFFNYNLDPAIISACRNIDELDIYLDCLEDNEIDDFYCFEIKYEVAPIKKD